LRSSAQAASPNLSRGSAAASLPASLTWVVIEDGTSHRALCVQASSPSRIRKFLRHKGNLYAVERGYGEDHLGRRLEGESRRRLARSLQRHANSDASQIMVEVMQIRAQVEAVLEMVARSAGLTREALTRPGRSPWLARARIRVAHELRYGLKLPLEEVAIALHLKDHSAVRYLLKKAYPELEQEVT